MVYQLYGEDVLRQMSKTGREVELNLVEGSILELVDDGVLVVKDGFVSVNDGVF